MIIQTERLILRPFCDEDHNWYYKMAKKKEFKNRLPGLELFNLKEAAMHINVFKKGDFINDFYYVITDKDNNIIGIIIAVRITTKTVDVSYFLLDKYRHNGYMHEALGMFMKKIRAEIENYRFRMIISRDNVESLNVIKKFEPVIEDKDSTLVCYV